MSTTVISQPSMDITSKFDVLEKVIFGEKMKSIEEHANNVLQAVRSFQAVMKQQLFDFRSNLMLISGVDISSISKTDDPRDTWSIPEGSELNVGDMVQKVAEEAFGTSDYVYDEASRMYYSISTGYYYDSASQLFYEPQSRTYYKYHDDTKSYIRMDFGEPSKKRRRRRRKKQKRKASDSDEDKSTAEVMEDGEVLSSCDSCSSETAVSSDTSLKTEEHETKCNAEEQFIGWPPCLRFVVKESNVHAVGTVMLLTYPGGSIGAADDAQVRITDDSVLQKHAIIRFDEELKRYLFTICEEDATCTLNGFPHAKDKFHILSHMDSIRLGTSCLIEVHLHERLLTCDFCEPGLTMAPVDQNSKASPIVTRSDRDRLRREELKNIKKKFGLHITQDNLAKKKRVSYEDRARNRRELVGSSCEHEKVEMASLQTAVPEQNKGFQMLKNMGWQTGSGLGKERQGNVDPVDIKVRQCRSGLGIVASDVTASVVDNSYPSTSSSGNSKRLNWEHAQQRYMKTNVTKEEHIPPL